MTYFSYQTVPPDFLLPKWVICIIIMKFGATIKKVAWDMLLE